MSMDKHSADLLAFQIVKQAVGDWKKARRRLMKNPNDIRQKFMLRDCERFFVSSYFENITGMNGRQFLRRLIDKERRIENEKYDH